MEEREEMAGKGEMSQKGRGFQDDWVIDRRPVVVLSLLSGILVLLVEGPDLINCFYCWLYWAAAPARCILRTSAMIGSETKDAYFCMCRRQ